jgi:hypothetical protein
MTDIVERKPKTERVTRFEGGWAFKYKDATLSEKYGTRDEARAALRAQKRVENNVEVIRQIIQN